MSEVWAGCPNLGHTDIHRVILVGAGQVFKKLSWKLSKNVLSRDAWDQTTHYLQIILHLQKHYVIKCPYY